MSVFAIIFIIVLFVAAFQILGKIFPSKSNDEYHLEEHPLSKTREYEQNHSLPDEFVAIDVETATSEQNSICQIGLTIVENGEIKETLTWLVRPPKNEYSKENIAIHGITPEMTEKAPGFTKLYSILFQYLNNKPLAAHYAYFDSRCLNSAISRTRKEKLTTPYYIDSCIAARRAYPSLENHKLPTVCNHLGISINSHHEAGADSLACAEILLKIGKSPRIETYHVYDQTAYNCYFYNRPPKPIRVYHQTWNEKYGNK